MFNPDDFKAPYNPVVDYLYEYEPGKLGSLLLDGHVEKLSIEIGDSSTFIPKGLKWYESYVDGQIQLTHAFWQILGYSSESGFRQDVRNETSTGWVERQLLNEMPERWHNKIRSYF